MRTGRDKPPGIDPMLQSLVDTHPEPFALVDKDFNVVACNRKYSEVYAGTDCSKVIGKKCHEISHKTATTCPLASPSSARSGWT